MRRINLNSFSLFINSFETKNGKAETLLYFSGKVGLSKSVFYLSKKKPGSPPDYFLREFNLEGKASFSISPLIQADLLNLNTIS